MAGKVPQEILDVEFKEDSQLFKYKKVIESLRPDVFAIAGEHEGGGISENPEKGSEE